jgi:branched-chain amino acid transport system permease protein
MWGFTFTNADPELFVFKVPFGQLERLWYLTLVLLVLAYLFAQNVLRSRAGRALRMVRDNEVVASVMGVDVRRYKAAAFVMSSMYAGLAGVLIALAFQRTVPDYFGLTLSIDYLAMIVIGGLGSARGAIAGATLVSALPLVLSQYSGSLGFLAQPGERGIGASDFSYYVFGALIVIVILANPGGLAALSRGRTTTTVAVEKPSNGVVHTKE